MGNTYIYLGFLNRIQAVRQEHMAIYSTSAGDMKQGSYTDDTIRICHLWHTMALSNDLVKCSSDGQSKRRCHQVIQYRIVFLVPMYCIYQMLVIQGRFCEGKHYLCSLARHFKYYNAHRKKSSLRLWRVHEYLTKIKHDMARENKAYKRYGIHILRNVKTKRVLHIQLSKWNSPSI